MTRVAIDRRAYAFVCVCVCVCARNEKGRGARYPAWTRENVRRHVWHGYNWLRGQTRDL